MLARTPLSGVGRALRSRGEHSDQLALSQDSPSVPLGRAITTNSPMSSSWMGSSLWQARAQVTSWRSWGLPLWALVDETFFAHLDGLPLRGPLLRCAPSKVLVGVPLHGGLMDEFLSSSAFPVQSWGALSSR